MDNQRFFRVSLGPAQCGADITNGSERATYVPMEHVFRVLKRPHRAINLMFTYYPFDKGWPKRASKVVAWKEGMGQWDLPYDDYDVYLGGPGGISDAEAYRQFRDVRRYGQDVHFTLTIDPKVPVKSLRLIAKELRAYGRVFFRINHECNGFWFQHNRRYSYKQVSDFFVKFHKILKEDAPLVETVLCLNGFDDPLQMHVGEKELAEAVRAADVIAIDRYLSLHYAWPNNFSNDPATYFDLSVEQWWKAMNLNRELLCEVRGDDSFPVSFPELNADSDVNGYHGQAKRITMLYDLVKKEKKDWLKSVTMYQFRDRGGLGLELESRVSHEFVSRLPSCGAYRKAASDPYYNPVMVAGEQLSKAGSPLKLRWYNSEKADGLSIRGKRHSASNRMRIKLDSGNYLIECNGKWFHSRGGSVDLKAAVFPGDKYAINIFCPPHDGTNSTGHDGNYLPYYQAEIRVRPEVES